MGSDADLVRRLSEEAFVKGDPNVVDEVLSEDFVSHDPPPGVPPTREGFRAVAEMVAEAISDRAMDFDEFLDATDGRVIENWLMTGTHTADAFGLPPSGQIVRVRGVEIWRCDKGKIVEHWGAIDMSDLAEKASAG